MSALLSPKAQQGILVFVHVPKAAGSTLRWIMDRQYSEDAVYRCDMHLYPSAFDDFRNLPADKLAKMRCLIGHLPYGVHRFLPGPVRYLTVLRNPVDRFLSEHAYLCNNKWAAEQLGIEEEQIESLDAYIEMQLQRNAMNFQTRQLSGFVDFQNAVPPFVEPVSGDALEMAKSNLANDFAVVGLQERFNESLLLMKRAFGWGNACYLRKNVTPRPVRRSEISPQIRNRIERYNELDIKLVEFAKERFEEQIRVYGPRFERDLEALKKKNERYFGPKGLSGKAKDLILKVGRRITNA